jgi:flagellar basal body-associated protein FliL
MIGCIFYDFMKILKSLMTYLALCLGAMLGSQCSSVAQTCGLVFNPNPGTAAVTINTYYYIDGSYTSPLNLAMFQDIVTSGNSTVPAGTYLGWCIDITDDIDSVGNYNVLMYSTCDPNLDSELFALGATYNFTYPATDTNDTAAQWNQLNYLLNHTASVPGVSGVTYWDIQCAIWNIIGGPLYSDATFASIGYPQYNENNVSLMTQAAQANAATWQPGDDPNDVIAVLLAMTAADATGDFPVQLTILQVPFITANCVTINAVENLPITPVTMVGSGGTGPYTFSATGLPAGLTMSSTGTISGTPTVSGIFNYTVTVTDSAGHQGTVNCSVAPFTASCEGITAVVGVAITPVTMTASGGAGGPYTFSATGLPAGLTMSTTGVISGTPTVIGTFPYTVTIKDSAGNLVNTFCSVIVSQASPSIITIQQPPSATVGASIADQATVSGGYNPTGTVTFNLYNNSTASGAPVFTDTETLSGGVATSKGYTSSATGTYYWVATYNGNTDNASVTSGAALEPVTISQATPTINTSQQPTNAIVGNSIADQATVSGGYNPTGTVTFNLYNNSTASGTPLFTATATLVSGVATSTGYTATATGTFYWVATYNGDTNNKSVTSGVALEPVTISQASPTINTTQQPASAIVGTSIADQATVSGGYNPTGTVTFNLYNNSTASGTPLFTATATLVSGVATSTGYTATATGTFYWVATYNGDANNKSVTSGAALEPVTISQASPTINTTQQPASAIAGASIADKATVSGGDSPTGTVTFNLYNNATASGTPVFTATATLSGGVATSTGYTATATGTYYWVATYNGDTNNKSVTSGAALEPVTISQASPTINTTQQPASAIVGASIADKATVSGGDSPTGTVTFNLYNNATASGTPVFTATATLSGGVATSTGYTATATGTYYWVATYNGDTNNKSVTSGAALEPVTVNSPPTANCVSITAVEGEAITPVTMTASGGTGSPYTFSATGLPTGLTMSSSGTISGKPTVSGTFSYTVTVKDSAGNTGTVNCSVSVCGLTLTCPPNVTIAANCTPTIYCTFTPSDWNSSCNAAGTPPNWWTSFDQQNHGNNCISSLSSWWTACTGQNPGNNVWNFCQTQQTGNNSNPSWGSTWSQNSAPSWCANFNSDNPNGNWWVPCNGNNPGNVLNNCFSAVYPSGYVQVGLANGYCVKLTSYNAVRQCLGFTGTPGCLNGNATNPNSCSAGSFCAEVLALQLNCDFGDAGSASGFGGPCGDLVLNDPTSPCNGRKVSDILQIANCCLGGGSVPSGCTPSYLCTLCSNLNQCFEGCQVSSWCQSHLVAVCIPLPSVSGKATVTASACSATPVLTYCDTVAPGSCPGSYVVTRTWTAVESDTVTNSCEQLITLTTSSISGRVVNDCLGAGCTSGKSTPNFSGDAGIAGVTVTLNGSSGSVTTTTDSNGDFTFAVLGGETYTVVVTPPAGYSLTYPTSGTADQTTVTLSACGSDTNLVFAYMGNLTSVVLIKTGPTTAACGQTITYNFAVTNTGNNCVTLTVNDPLLGGQIFSQSSVGPGQGFVFSKNYTLIAADIGTLVNTATATDTPAQGLPVTSSSSATTTVTTVPVTQSICCNFNSQMPANGWLWCNSHVSCKPGQPADIHCSGATITITGNSGKIYTYPVPDCDIVFAANCTVGSCTFNGTKWTTTLPVSGDDEIFLAGCAIPCNPDFANARTVCWQGNFTCNTPGTTCNWQWGAACYNNSQPACGSISVKACHNTPCGYNGNSGDHAGTPENCKPYCVGGGTGGGGSNWTGSWSGTGSCTFNPCE